jgi:2',3'-cyclic-nucleotide 2'-phosphodiesterase (5'-nucleotidase family)
VGNHQLAQIARAYAIYNLRGLKVAVIGMANLSSLTSIGEGGNSLGITPLEQNEVVRTLVDYLHPMVDLVIVLTHLGLVEDAELVRGYETVVWKDRRPKNWTETIEDLGDGRVSVKVPGVENIDLIVGGHLHTVTNPPQRIAAQSGRETILMHSGAFAKYLGRIDLVVRDDVERGGKRIVSHKYQVFPIDERLAPYADGRVLEMMEPYAIGMHQQLDLRRVIGFAPVAVLRHSAQGNGDSVLGDLVTESMRVRRRVEAQFSLTNSLGIRDNIYAGPITLEEMYNVFPFENTVTVIYLSGSEVQDMLNFVASKSASRGCASQAAVAGITWTLDCGQVVLNRANNNDPTTFISPAKDIKILGEPLHEHESYKVAVNEYIAAGGSGFRMLKRNTTKFNTGLSLRDALIDYIGTMPVCGDYEKKNNICGSGDTTSQALCKQIGRRGRIPGDLHGIGPYAETPCVVGHEDGRIKLTMGSAEDMPGDDLEGDE